jgi:hypothetical protein
MLTTETAAYTYFGELESSESKYYGKIYYKNGTSYQGYLMNGKKYGYGEEKTLDGYNKGYYVNDVLSSSISNSNISYSVNILDQGNIGSCVASAYSGVQTTLYNGTINGSVLYYYYNARLGCNLSPYQDTGLDLLVAELVFKLYGYVSTNSYPYTYSNLYNEPSLSIYTQASLNYPIICTPIPQTNNALQTSLLNNNPILFGFNVYSSFMTQTVAKNGIVPYPNSKKERNVGGHCMYIINFTTYNNRFYYQAVNSWGKGWGCSLDANINPNFVNNNNGGCCWIPGNYLTNKNLAYEFLSCSLPN